MKRLCTALLLVSFSITVFASEQAPSTTLVPSVLSNFFSSILHRFAKEQTPNDFTVIQLRAQQVSTKKTAEVLVSEKEKKITMDNFPIDLEKKIILAVLLRQCYDDNPKRLKADSVSGDTFDSYIQSRMTQLGVPDEIYVAKRVQVKIYVQDSLRQAQEKATQKNQLNNNATDELCSQAISRAHDVILEKINQDSQSSIDWSHYI